MQKLKKALPYVITALLPLAALAATATDVLNTTNNLLRNVVPILLLIGTIVFLWGVITYLTAGPNEEKQKYGRYLIVYGLVGLFAMVAIWGIVRVLTSTFGVGGEGIPERVGDIR